MISTAITRLFPLPSSPSGSASVEVNTETGYKFIDGVPECGTTSLGQQRTPGMCARDAERLRAANRASPVAGFLGKRLL